MYQKNNKANATKPEEKKHVNKCSVLGKNELAELQWQ